MINAHGRGTFLQSIITNVIVVIAEKVWGCEYAPHMPCRFPNPLPTGLY